MAERMGTGPIAETKAGTGWLPGRLAMLALMAGFAGGCMGLERAEDTPDPATAESAVAASKSTQETGQQRVLVADRDAFLAEGFLVWDGEETLKGRWIAFPELDAARRVRVTNEETGAATDAAMFRRDEGAAGPRILVSSQAAEALGLVPGGATQVTIEALTYADPAELAAAAEKIAAETAEDEIAEEDQIAHPVDPPAEDEGPAEIAAIYGGAENAGGASDEPGGLSALIGAALGLLSPGDSSEPDGGAADATAPATEPEPADEPEPAAEGPFFLQAGAFTETVEAETLATDLREAGLPVEIRAPASDQPDPTLVLVGPYDNAAARDDARERLRALAIEDAVPVDG